MRKNCSRDCSGTQIFLSGDPIIKKQGLGRGVEALIPAETARIEERPVSDVQRAAAAMRDITVIIDEALAGMDGQVAERLLRRIVALCNTETKGGGYA